MSIIIKGLDMPTDRALTIRISPNGGVLKVLEFDPAFVETKAQAIEIPTPHGRLIDGDELRNTIKDVIPMWGLEKFPTYGQTTVMGYITNAPTILVEEKE